MEFSLRTLLISFAIFIVLGIYIKRLWSHTEVDDVHPLLPVKNHLVADSKYLWVIPAYNGVPITNYPEWCRNLKKRAELHGKILGMHGICHPEAKDPLYRDGEFCRDIPIENIQWGMEIFKNAFGYYPKYFKAPHCLATRKNIETVETLGMEYKGILNQILHKVYHCDEKIQPWYLHEWIVALF